MQAGTGQGLQATAARQVERCTRSGMQTSPNMSSGGVASNGKSNSSSEEPGLGWVKGRAVCAQVNSWVSLLWDGTPSVLQRRMQAAPPWYPALSCRARTRHLSRQTAFEAPFPHLSRRSACPAPGSRHSPEPHYFQQVAYLCVGSRNPHHTQHATAESGAGNGSFAQLSTCTLQTTAAAGTGQADHLYR